MYTLLYLLCLVELGLGCYMRAFSLVADTRGYSLVAEHGLLIVVASLVVVHRL